MILSNTLSLLEPSKAQYFKKQALPRGAYFPTGRIRGHVSYTRQKNSPFQGLAADGNKLALFNLVHAGYAVCGFVHDEALINIPEDCDLTAAVEDVQRIMRESMQEFTPDVPIETSALLADRWYKDIEANEYDGQGNIVPFSRGTAHA